MYFIEYNDKSIFNTMKESNFQQIQAIRNTFKAIMGIAGNESLILFFRYLKY